MSSAATADIASLNSASDVVFKNCSRLLLLLLKLLLVMVLLLVLLRRIESAAEAAADGDAADTDASTSVIWLLSSNVESFCVVNGSPMLIFKISSIMKIGGTRNMTSTKPSILVRTDIFDGDFMLLFFCWLFGFLVHRAYTSSYFASNLAIWSSFGCCWSFIHTHIHTHTLTPLFDFRVFPLSLLLVFEYINLSLSTGVNWKKWENQIVSTSKSFLLLFPRFTLIHPYSRSMPFTFIVVHQTIKYLIKQMPIDSELVVCVFLVFFLMRLHEVTFYEVDQTGKNVDITNE